jgi:FkbM family methyltransferase
VFEADPRVTKVLRGNLLALGLEDVVVHDAAVWDQEGELCFASDGADSGRVCEASGEISVRAVRLSDWTTAPVDFLKLDIEGAEFVVLRDLYRSGGLRNVRRLGCEIHGRSGDPAELAEIFTMLSNFGFQYTVSHARSAPDLVGPQFGLPFGGPASGKYLLHLYAWQQGF